MPKVTFLPQSVSFDAEPNTKLLATANRNKVPIRFGCASCRCGTCGVKLVAGAADVSKMKDDERALLTRMALPVDGTIRLACQTRVGNADVTVDLDFQNEYSPDDGDDD
jgi:ferredoxin